MPLGEDRIKAINRFTSGPKGDVIIHGYFNVQTKEFFATPEVFTLKKIPTQILHLFDINDPGNLLSVGKKSRQFLLAWKDAVESKKEADARDAAQMKRQELHRKAVMDSAYPGQLYTVPLLRSSAEYKCPYCGRTLLMVKSSNVSFTETLFPTIASLLRYPIASSAIFRLVHKMKWPKFGRKFLQIS